MKSKIEQSHCQGPLQYFGGKMLLRTYAPLLGPSPILQAHPPHDDQYLSKTYVSLMTHH